MAPTKKELKLTVFVFLLLPIVLEVMLRLAGAQFDAQLYEPDCQLGWKLRAGATGLVSTETRQYVKINTHGFRDAERSFNKPLKTVRIAVLGNSWTEALQVPLERTFCSVLEKKLSEKSCFVDQRVEVLNFGVAGYSTGQELLTLRYEVWKYHPDLVLLAFNPARDIANNVRELNNAVDPERSPYFVYREGALVLDDSFRELPALQPRQIALQNFGYEINRRIRVLQAINALQQWGKIRIAMAAAKDRAEKSGDENLEYNIYKPPALPAIQMAWKVTEGLLMAMRDEVKAHGAEFRLVILATRPQVDPDTRTRQELAQKLGLQDFSYADERLEKFGAMEAIPVTRLAPELAAYAEKNQIYLNGFNRSNQGKGHWNETGHRIAAEVIAADLCRAGGRTVAAEPSASR